VPAELRFCVASFLSHCVSFRKILWERTTSGTKFLIARITLRSKLSTATGNV
jgi:hypothetical protein